MRDEILLKIDKYGYKHHKTAGVPTSSFYCNFCYHYHLLTEERLSPIKPLKDKMFQDKDSNLFRFHESIIVRFQQMLLLKDLITQATTRYQDNDAQFLAQTFTYSFIITAYSILDSLAWYIYYKRNLKSMNKMQITLNWNDKTKDKFKKELIKVDPQLYAKLSDSKVQEWINFVQMYRDTIQHRGLVSLFPVDDRNKGTKYIGIELSPELNGYDFQESRHGMSADELKVYQNFGTTFENVNDFIIKIEVNLEKLLNETFHSLV